MKQLKDRAKKERQEILESEKATILKEELHRQVEDNLEELRLAKAARRRKIRAIGLTSTAGLLLILSIGIVIFQNKGYVSAYENNPSDIAFLNETLTKTQVKGDFQKITLTYEVQSNRPEYFQMEQETEETDISYRSVFIDVIINRNCSDIEEKVYPEETEFLGYTLQYKETQDANHSPDGTALYGYKIEAFMDTGAERYILEYYEYRTDTEFTFTEYLQETIITK